MSSASAKNKAAAAQETADADALRAMLDTMWTARAFEERASELYAEGEIKGLLHLGIGQEGVSIGACSVLDPGDVVYGTHRPHVHAIAKGADITKLMAELAGRSTGYCGGKGGSMHVAAPEVGFITATGIVAGNIPLGLGAADEFKRRGSKKIAVVFHGDGASQTGSFHESINIASLWKLPLVMICENNGWAEFTPLSSHTNVERLAVHAETYGIPTVTIDGNDAFAVREAVAVAVERARSGGGPTFIECLTQRLRGHYEGDPGKYRELSQLEEWKKKDPIQRFMVALAERGVEFDADKVEQAARDRVEVAIKEALAGPLPTEADVASQVYA
ncbi:MAG TPA: thiamine pyrophosphate-dependent dehydrogenase E1 component subunit alpha [Solirubrobacteraceae bacterium]|nr:thiamine pyrophosphate-dependent dehydrogenase E1 component subunit alpha [Solirubrobacteraceae bacterium]